MSTPAPSVPTLPVNADVFVFDVCDTLFYSNTTFDFLRFVLEQQGSRGKQAVLKILTARWSPLFVGLVVWQKATGGDPVKAAALRLLAGTPRKELYELGRRFVAEYLPTRRIAQTHELLAGLERPSTRVLLLSASLDPIIAALAVALGDVESVSSQLEYDANERCTGRLQQELTGRKQDALRYVLGASAATVRLAVATDNFTDRELVTQAAVRYVIVHNAAAKNFWQELNPHFIEAYLQA
jgi:phosphoserine phosphatase